HQISPKTRSLQYALFRMLTVQTIVPLCSVHLACASVLLLPIFGQGQEFLGDICPPLLSFFAPLDALVVLLLMKDYRVAAQSMVTCSPFFYQVDASNRLVHYLIHLMMYTVPLRPVLAGAALLWMVMVNRVRNVRP
ncbi:hypothetical protein PFISCL1PPCAC_13245, partial [Pristionchus fissidentatus]